MPQSGNIGIVVKLILLILLSTKVKELCSNLPVTPDICTENFAKTCLLLPH